MAIVTLTELARRQAAADPEALLGQAYGELDRRGWGEETDFGVHVFASGGVDFVMYPVSLEEIEVDLCVWLNRGPYKVSEGHPLYGKEMQLPRGASGRGPQWEE